LQEIPGSKPTSLDRVGWRAAVNQRQE
jgi:hypothetical protein